MSKEAEYREAMERGDPHAASELGVLLLERGDLDGAEAALRRAIALGNVGSAANLGVLLERRGELSGAETMYRMAMAADIAEGAFNLALLLKEKGDLDGCEEALRKGAELGHPDAANNLGVLLADRGDLDAAEEAFRLAMERGSAVGARGHAAVLKKLGRADEIGAGFPGVGESDEIGVALEIAIQHLEQGRRKRARSVLDQAAEESGTDGALLYGSLLENLGDLDRAEVAYREAVDRDIGVAAFCLGKVLLKKGDKEGAQEMFDAAERMEGGEGGTLDAD
jgi:Flp pilus assembly protein TadD